MSKGLVFEVDWISGLVVGEYEGGYGYNIGVWEIIEGIVDIWDWLLGSMKEVMDIILSMGA